MRPNPVSRPAVPPIRWIRPVGRLALCVLLILAMAGCEAAPSVDLKILAYVNQNPNVTVNAGTTMLVHVEVLNTLPNGTTSGSISVTDSLPAGLSFVSSPTMGWSCSAEGQDLNCFTFGTVSGDRLQSLDLEILVDPQASGQIDDIFRVIYAGDNNSQNNTAILNITVIAAVTPAPLLTMALDFQMAANAGATIIVDQRINEHCFYLGGGDWLNPDTDGGVSWDGGRLAGVEFMADCGTKQGEAFITAFATFTLKNGWVVKSFTRDDWSVGRTAFDIDTPPQPGSAIPLIAVHIRSYGASLTEGAFSVIREGIQIFIEGPSDKSPYQ